MATAAKFTLRGTEEMRAKIQAFIRHWPDKVEKAARAEMEIELKEVQARTPVDTGNLRDSERIVISWTWQKLHLEIVAGGSGVDYAFHVHEDLEVFHRVGQAKYLESVLRESAPFLIPRIAIRMGIVPEDIV